MLLESCHRVLHLLHLAWLIILLLIECWSVRLDSITETRCNCLLVISLARAIFFHIFDAFLGHEVFIITDLGRCAHCMCTTSSQASCFLRYRTLPSCYGPVQLFYRRVDSDLVIVLLKLGFFLLRIGAQICNWLAILIILFAVFCARLNCAGCVYRPYVWSITFHFVDVWLELACLPDFKWGCGRLIERTLVGCSHRHLDTLIIKALRKSIFPGLVWLFQTFLALTGIHLLISICMKRAHLLYSV